MVSLVLLIASLASAGLIEGAAVDVSSSVNIVARQRGGGQGGFRGGRQGSQQNGQNNGQNGGQTCLNNDLIQSASGLTGQEPGTEGIKAGQAPSAVDKANFINFCQGQEITNGMQILTGSCNGIPMGKIPAQTNMITAVITEPKVGVQVPSDTTFDIEVQTQHLDAGFFVNPTTNYYTAPQDLNQNGDIIGHCHVTVQDIGNMQATTPPDPTKFAFFKGIDDAGNGQGLLKATVTDGLPVGVYRVCTMIAARNHQPVNMPVAQRGAQDDCTKFEVVASGNGGQGQNQNDKNGNAQQNQDQEGFLKNKGDKGNGADGNSAGGNAGNAGNNAGNANGGNNAGNAGEAGNAGNNAGNNANNNAGGANGGNNGNGNGGNTGNGNGGNNDGGADNANAGNDADIGNNAGNANAGNDANGGNNAKGGDDAGNANAGVDANTGNANGDTNGNANGGAANNANGNANSGLVPGSTGKVGGEGQAGGEGRAGGEGKAGGEGQVGGEGKVGGEGRPGGEGARRFRRAKISL